MNGEEEKIYKLNKALYGLKQAPRVWYGEKTRTSLSVIFNRVQMMQHSIPRAILVATS